MSNILTNEITWKLKTNKGENKCIRKWHINSSESTFPFWSYVPSFVEKDQFLRFPFYNLQNNVDVLAEINLIFLQMELLQNFYETTLDALKEAKNERLWFKTNTKLGKLYYDREDYNKLQKILKQLHLSCQVNIYLCW